MIKKLFISILAAFFFFSLNAKTSVWKVSDENSSIYLGGTYEFLRSIDYPLPPEFDAAYDDSTRLVFETDVARLQAPGTQRRIIMEASLKEWNSLRSLLSPDVYKMLNGYCENAGISLRNYSSYKPVIIFGALYHQEIQKRGYTLDGVDLYYCEIAKDDEKPIGYLESVSDYVDFICSMGDGNQDNYVSYSLKELASFGDSFEAFLEAWRVGDRQELASKYVYIAQEESPEIYDSLIVNRVNKWMPQIEACFESEEQEFVLVGVGYLVGDHGILRKLESSGYTVEQLDSE